MFHSNQRKNDSNSILSNDSSTLKSVWHRVSQLFHSRSSSSDCTLGDNNSSLSGGSSSRRRRRSDRRYSSLSTESNASSSLSKGYAFSSSDISSSRYNNKTNRKRKLVADNHSLTDPPQSLVIPPFSPTYCRPNEFPYSNFYVRLPNGKWMIRYRSGNRDILGTDEFEGYMI